MHRIGPWLSLRDPKADATTTAAPPFRVVLDTGFDGTLLMPSHLFVQALGGKMPSGAVFTGERLFRRVRGGMRAKGFQLKLWGHPEADGPHAEPPPQSVLLTDCFEVFASLPNPLPQEHPLLLGLQGLEILEAHFQLDYRTFLADLIAEVP